MSLHRSWIIVRDTSEEALRDLFDRRKDASRRLKYRALSNGWSVVCHDRNGFSGRTELMEASKLNFALRLDVHDQTDEYYARLTAAQDGRFLWEIGRSAEEWTLDGTLPMDMKGLSSLGADFEGPFGDEHDIPLALAKRISGFDVADWFPVYKRPPYPPPEVEPKTLLGRLWRAYVNLGRDEMVGIRANIFCWTYALVHIFAMALVIYTLGWLYRLGKSYLIQ